MSKIWSESDLLTTIIGLDFTQGELFFLFIVEEAVGIPIPGLNEYFAPTIKLNIKDFG